MTAPRRGRFELKEWTATIAAVLGLLYVANVVFALAWVRPRERDYRALADQNAPRIRDVKERTKIVEAVERHLEGLRKAQEDLRRLREDVLSTREKKLIATQLEVAKLVRQFGINMKRVQSDNEVFEKERVDRFGMVVPLEGGYANLRKFLQAVESSERLLVVEGVSLAEGGDGGALLQLNIELATYFDLPSPEPATAAQGGERRPTRRAG